MSETTQDSYTKKLSEQLKAHYQQLTSTQDKIVSYRDMVRAYIKHAESHNQHNVMLSYHHVFKVFLFNIIYADICEIIVKDDGAEYSRYRLNEAFIKAWYDMKIKVSLYNENLDFLAFKSNLSDHSQLTVIYQECIANTSSLVFDISAKIDYMQHKTLAYEKARAAVKDINVDTKEKP